MAYNDIQKLRQQQIFSPIEDITYGGMDMNYDEDMGGYDMPNPYAPPPSPTYGNPGMQQQASSSQGPPPPVTPPSVPTYGQQGPPDPNASIQQTMDAINKVYTPETVDRDRLRKLMDAAPERQPPSFGRALVAAGLSLKAQDPIATSEAVMYAPHRRNMADWTAKADPFYKTADLENRSNINERALAGNVVTSVTQANRLAEQGRVADQKNEVAQKKAESERIRSNAIAAKNAGYKVYKAGDRYIGVNPEGRRVDIGPSGGLDRETELDIIGEWSVKAAEARGEAGVKVAQAGAVANNRDIVSQDEVLYRRNPDGTMSPVEGIPKGTTNRVGTPRAGGAANSLESRRQLNDRLQNEYQTDESVRKFIKKTGDSTYSFRDRPVEGASTGWFGDPVSKADIEAYDTFRREIDPSYSPPVVKQGGIGGSVGKEEPAKSSGIGPTKLPEGGFSQATVDDWSGNPQGSGIAPSAPREAGPSVDNATQQRAIGYLMQHNLPVTPANIAHAIRTGKLQPDAPRR